MTGFSGVRPEALQMIADALNARGIEAFFALSANADPADV
jgi:hypothetical protein